MDLVFSSRMRIGPVCLDPRPSPCKVNGPFLGYGQSDLENRSLSHYLGFILPECSLSLFIQLESNHFRLVLQN